MRISKVLPQIKILFLIGLIDLLLTLIVVNLFGFGEENNFFRGILARSPWLFAVVKVASLSLCLGIIEFTRQKSWISEQIVKRYLKIGIAAYVGLYIVFMLKVNIMPLLHY